MSTVGKTWRQAFERALISGSWASIFSTMALVLCSKRDRRRSAAALNGPSQWLWGETEAYERRATVRHTIPGFIIHHSMSIGWATLHEKTMASTGRLQAPFARAGAAMCTAAVAYLIDYYVTPPRFRPGFEKHLKSSSMFIVYASFATGLAFAQFWPERKWRHRHAGETRGRVGGSLWQSNVTVHSPRREGR